MMKLKRNVFETAYVTQFGAWKETIYPIDPGPVPVAFVVKLPGELTPAGITNRLGQVVVFEHPLNVEVLDIDLSKLIDNSVAKFMQKVLALISNLFVLAGKFQPGFLPAVRAFLLPGQFLLQLLEFGFRGSQMAGVVNFLACRQDSEVGQAQVDADGLAFIDWLVYFHFALNRDEEFPALGFRDGNILGFAFNGPVEDSAHPADFGQVDFRAFYFEALRVTNRLLVVLLFESWVVSPAFKEIDIGPVQIFKFLLQDLAVCLLEPDKIGLAFQFLEAVSSSYVTQAPTHFLVIALTQIQTPVIGEASMPKLDSQRVLLFLGWVNPELEGFLYQHQKSTFGLLSICCDAKEYAQKCLISIVAPENVSDNIPLRRTDIIARLFGKDKK